MIEIAWASGGERLGIGKIPGRKSFCLYTVSPDGIVYTPQAYFRTEAAASEVEALLRRMFTLREELKP